MTSHLHDTLPFLLNRVAARTSDAVNQEFRPLGLNVFAARVLILLHLHEASTVGELAEKAALDQSTLSHILRRLERDGLLKRVRVFHDNRSVMVSLTPSGNDAGAHCWKAAKNHDRLMRTGLSAAEVKTLQKLLGRLYKNIPSFDERVKILKSNTLMDRTKPQENAGVSKARIRKT